MSGPPEQPGQWGERSVALAERLVLLADSLADDVESVGLTTRLVEAGTELLGAGAASLLLSDDEGRFSLAASSCEASGEGSRLLDLFRLQGEHGPCRESTSTGEPVVVDRLREALERWPEFVSAADALGFVSAYTFPLRRRDQVVGGLNLFCTEAAGMAEPDRRVAQALADVATISLLQRQARHRESELAAQLQGALDSRVVIEQAKGILAEHAALDMTSAFEVLRRYSRNNNERLSDVAASVVNRTVPPRALLAPHRPP